MADYLTTDTELTSIAEAIRTKGGTSKELTYPTEFVSAIDAIRTGTYVTDTAATVTSGTASITSLNKTYNSTSGKFDITGSANVSAPTVGTAGYISSSDGTKNAKTGGATVSATIDKIAGTASISATTKKPSITKRDVPSGVTQAASGNATTTAPSSGVYVAVKSDANTATLTPSVSITTAGYGDSTNHGITASGATVGAAASDTTYVPITTTSASVNGKTVSYGSGWITAGSKSVADGAYSASVSSHSVTTTPVVTGSLSGTVTNIGTTTKPSSGTDGTDYWTITPSGSVTTTGVSTAKGKATIGTAGYIATGNKESSASTVDITPTVSAGTARYLTKATSSTSNGTATATAGTASTSVTGMVTTSTNTGYSVSASATGGNASVTASSATVGAGYNPSSVTASTTAKSATGASASDTKYIQKGVLSASVSSNTSGSASMSATGFTPLSSGTSDYYVSLATSAGSVKAKAQVGTEGYVKTETNETAATSVAVTGNGSKVYIPAGSVTQNAPTINTSTGVVTATSTVTEGYVGADTKSNTLSLSTQSGKTVSPTESEQTAVAAGKYTTGAIKVGAISSTYVGSGIDRNDSDDLSVSGATVTAPAGYYAESASASVANGSVTQNAPTVNSTTGLVTATSTITAGYVGADTKSNTLQLSTQGAATITPGTSAKTAVAAGKYTTGAVSVAGDADLVAGNIKKGVDIFGVTGTFTTTPSGKNALTAAALRSGYAGFINGSQVNGSMADTSVTEGTTTVSSGTATRGEWSQTAGYTTARTIEPATFANTETTGTTYVDISSTTEAPVLVSGGYMYINKGWTDDLKISLAKLVPDGASADLASGVILSGYSAYNNDGTLIAGNIPTKTALTVSGKTVTAPAGYYASNTSANVATGTVTSGSASITSLTKTYNSTSGKFDITGSADVSAPSVGTAGYISSSEGTRNKKTGGATVSTTIDKIVGTASISATTKKPSITKRDVPSGVTQAASGNATTTAPTTGVYVAVKSDANTATLTPSVSITTAGYGDSTNHGITASGASVGAAASDTTYIPITTTSASVSGKTVSYGSGWIAAGSKSVAVGTVTSGSATISSASYAYNSTSGKFDVTGSASIGAPSVGTAGYISSSEGTRNGNTASLSTTVNKISGSTSITGTTTTTPSISKQDVPSGVTNAASGAATTTAPSSGVYVAVKSAANTGTLTATPSVSTAGYGDSTNHGISGNTATVGANASAVTYVPITTTSASVSGKTVSYGSGWITAGSKSVADGDYSASVSSHSISTTPVVTGALSGTGTDIGTTTKPSGTDGTDYWTYTPGGSVTTTGVSSAKGKATIGTAGYITTGNKETSASTVNITPTVNNGTARYLTKATTSTTNGTASATANAGTASIAKQPSASASATANGMDGGYYTDTTTSSYYVDCSASAASGYSTATGGSASASVTASSVTVGAGYNPSSVTASTNASSTGNKTGTSATSTEVTASQSKKIYLKPAGISWSGGGLSNTTNYSGTPTVSLGIDSQSTSDISITDTAQDSGYYVKLTGSTAKLTGTTKVTRADYKETRTAGYLPARAATTILASTTSSPSVTVNAASKTRYLTLPTATFANSGTSGTTYTDISSSGPVLVAGDYLYINKGWTPDCKISLAKLVPDGSDVKGHGEYIISGHSAYDNDGVLVAGTIPTLASSDISVNGATVTVPVGKYTGESGATAVTKTIDSGTVSTTFAADGMSTYFNAGTSSDKNVTITPKYTNTAGYVAAHSTATNNGGTTYYKIKTVSGSIGGSVSGGSATAAISNVNSMATISDVTGKTAGRDYWTVKATATGSAGSFTPKYTVSTAGWIGGTVTGGAASVSVSSDSTGKSINIPKATFDKSGASVYCITAGYIPALSSPVATISNGAVTAGVSSNIAGSASMTATGFTTSSSATNYYVTLSTSPGSVKAKATGVAGYVTSSTTNETPATNVNVTGNGTKLYIPAGSVSSNLTCSGATISTTNSSGIAITPTHSITKGYIPDSAGHGTTQFINGVTITKPGGSAIKTFSITVPNGSSDTITFVFNVDSSGNVTITDS